MKSKQKIWKTKPKPNKSLQKCYKLFTSYGWVRGALCRVE